MKKAAQLQARMVKKQQKPKRIRAYAEDDFDSAPKKKKKKLSSKSSFDQELTSTSQKALKKFRSG